MWSNDTEVHMIWSYKNEIGQQHQWLNTTELKDKCKILLQILSQFKWINFYAPRENRS